MSRQAAKRGFDPSRGGSRRRNRPGKPRESGSFLTTFALIVAAGTLALWLIDRPGKVERTGIEPPPTARNSDAG
ncbi:MAG: hypothetical protein LCH69_18325 [Proteobacteria bacterium]|nr:hypothetical protein [Pseudomonadota bacterium]